MAENISKALDALVTLRNFCKEHSCLEGQCPFYRTDSVTATSNSKERCTFLCYTPSYWEKPFIPEYHPNEMALVKGFFANGYKTIQRDYGGILFAKDDGERGVYFPTDSFQNLPFGSCVSLKDFIMMGEKYGKEQSTNH